jgi:hypothetical protein
MTLPIQPDSQTFVNLLYKNAIDSNLFKTMKQSKNNTFTKATRKLMSSLRQSRKTSQELFFQKKIKHTLIPITTRNELVMNSLFNLTQNIQDIREYILSNTKYILCFEFTLPYLEKHRTFVVHFSVFNEDDIPKYHKYMNSIVTFLVFLSTYGELKCSTRMNLYMNLTPFKKQIPSSSMTPLTESHVNSAMTYVCKREGEIFIFREEEWLKVFIHECFHSFGLDFSGFMTHIFNGKLYELFNISLNEFDAQESYCEFWATYLNVMYIVLQMKVKSENVLPMIEYLMLMEAHHSLFQMTKVLDHYHTNYNLIVKKKIDTSFIFQSTPVFSYYILSTVLIYNYRDFIEYCFDSNHHILKFNRTKTNVDKFLRFIRFMIPKLSDDNDKAMKFYTTLGEKSTYSEDYKKYLKTMRMSLLDYKIDSF